MSKITELAVWGWVSYHILERCSWSQFKVCFTLLASNCKIMSCTCSKLHLACSKFCGCRYSCSKRWSMDNTKPDYKNLESIYWLIGTLTFAILCGAMVFCLFSIWLYYPHSYLFSIVFIGLQFPWNSLTWYVWSQLHPFRAFYLPNYRFLVLVIMWNMLRIKRHFQWYHTW